MGVVERGSEKKAVARGGKRNFTSEGIDCRGQIWLELLLGEKMVTIRSYYQNPKGVSTTAGRRVLRGRRRLLGG